MFKRFLYKYCKWVSNKFPLLHVALLFLSTVLAFGALYWLLTPSQHGILEANQSPEAFDLFHGIYFSVVTASSLGYGDFRPVGVSRILATIEVVLGLFFIGVLIASYTSKKVTSIVSRSLASAIYSRLEAFTKSFYDLEGNIRGQSVQVSEIVRDQYSKQFLSGLSNEIYTDFRTFATNLSRDSRNLYEYSDAESQERLFFELITDNSLLLLLNSIHDAMFELEQFSEEYTRAAREIELPGLFQAANRRYIVNSVTDIKKALRILADGVDKRPIRDMANDADLKCDFVLRAFSLTPEEPRDMELADADTPQSS